MLPVLILVKVGSFMHFGAPFSPENRYCNVEVASSHYEIFPSVCGNNKNLQSTQELYLIKISRLWWLKWDSGRLCWVYKNFLKILFCLINLRVVFQPDTFKSRLYLKFMSEETLNLYSCCFRYWEGSPRDMRCLGKSKTLQVRFGDLNLELKVCED